MKIAIVLNGISLKKNYFYKKIFLRLRESFKVEVFETVSINDAVSLASKAVDKRYDMILAAGGDGTLHQVVNGVLTGRQESKSLPVIGLIPIGGGNDFARSLGVTDKPEQIETCIRNFKTRKVDVGIVYYTGASGENEFRYFINVADIGMGPEVVRRVMNSGRGLGPSMAYYQAIISTFFSYKPMVVHAKTESWAFNGITRSLALGIGKYYGHGLCIAPDAILDDGLMTAFICGNVSVFDFIRYSGTLKKGRKINIPEIQYKHTNNIELTSDKPCMIEADGEFLGHLPASVYLTSRQLDFLV